MEEAYTLQSSQIGKILQARGLTISTAESCTGGLLSHALTSVSGSSAYFKGGVVAYSNEIKEQVLSVRRQTLVDFGAVSEETAREMAEGIKILFKTDFALSTTGIAGPTGGSLHKPVGLVWIGISTPAGTQAYECFFKGSRLAVMIATVDELLNRLLENLESMI